MSSMFILSSIIYDIIKNIEDGTMSDLNSEAMFANRPYFNKAYLYKRIININKESLDSIVKRINYYIMNSIGYQFSNVKEYIKSLIRIHYKLDKFEDIKKMRAVDYNIAYYNTKLLYKYAYNIYSEHKK